CPRRAETRRRSAHDRIPHRPWLHHGNCASVGNHQEPVAPMWSIAAAPYPTWGSRKIQTDVTTALATVCPGVAPPGRLCPSGCKPRIEMANSDRVTKNGDKKERR